MECNGSKTPQNVCASERAALAHIDKTSNRRPKTCINFQIINDLRISRCSLVRDN